MEFSEFMEFINLRFMVRRALCEAAKPWADTLDAAVLYQLTGGAYGRAMESN